MKRLYLVAAVLGLWPCAAGAQEGLAPTAPVVPAPVLQNGKVLTPPGSGWGRGESRTFAASQWSPFRNPATATAVQPVTVVPQLPLPTGVSTPGAADCGPGGCASGGRDRSCWAKLKAFLCYHETPAGPPRQPTPYRTPLMGMFPCTPVGLTGCASGGCATPAPAAPIHHAPTTPGYAIPPMMPPPGVGRVPQPVTTAGAVAMPARGAPASVQPTWQGRVTPEGPVMPTGYKYPAPNK